MTNEEFYDTELAPVLVELARKCQERGINFQALVEYETNEIAETRVLPAQPGFALALAVMASMARVNIDAFLIGAKQYAEEHGHSSVFLKVLGVAEGEK
jgi:hypothetical protein